MKKQMRILAFAVILTSVQAKRLGQKRQKNDARQQVTSLTLVDSFQPTSHRVSLTACEGHCHDDAECASGLKCFRRTAFEAVPGCSGLGESGLNYCYDGKSIDMSTSSTSQTSQNTKLELRRDSNAASQKINDSIIKETRVLQSPFLYQGGGPPPTSAPVTSSVTALNVGEDDTSVAYVTASDPTLAEIAQGGQPLSAFPLQRCEGNCFYDDDCEGTLKCFEVMQHDSAVPGCSGQPVPGNAHCFDVADLPADTNPNTENGGFRLKMYWEEGFLWQDESFDRRWCLECGSYCVVNSCNSPTVSRFEFVENPNGYQIKLAGEDRCLEKVRTLDIVVVPCDSSVDSQLFEGDFDQYRFEMHPKGFSSGCLSQNHHPKAYEYVYMEDCSSCRADTTNYWTKY